MRRALVLAMFCASGCFTLGTPPSGYEVDELGCADGRDNDLDGRTDCQDEDCLMHGHCGERIPNVPNPGPENTFESCSDGIDNDDDGQYDCGDRQCQSIMELCCLSEVDNPTCSDGRDNDGNGFADCGDFSCRNNRFVDACESETNCTDRLDNDGDRSTDCRDRDCEMDDACRPVPETSCTDGEDNNGDGLADCRDPACYADAACTGPENTVERCLDGNDNDGNGFGDCAEFSCFNPREDPPTGAAVDQCLARAENTPEKCTDGMDNDENGFTDCGDFSCFDPGPPVAGAAIEVCMMRAEITLDRCMDGIDNDENGFIDCMDFSCSRNTDAEVVGHCRNQGEANVVNCQDGIDNDGNGFVDCADFSCGFYLIGWGIDLCTTDNDCPIGAICDDGFCSQACGGAEPPCAAGTQCIGGQCLQACVEHSDCDLGETCYATRCLALSSPCFESLSFDEDTTIQGGGGIPVMTTPADRIAMVVASCTDGRDNDGDGFTDCADWECNYDPQAVGADGRPLCRSAGGHTCIMGPSAGEPCTTDEQCAAISGACVLTGPADQTLVCP